VYDSREHGKLVGSVKRDRKLRRQTIRDRRGRIAGRTGAISRDQLLETLVARREILCDAALAKVSSPGTRNYREIKLDRTSHPATSDDLVERRLLSHSVAASRKEMK